MRVPLRRLLVALLPVAVAACSDAPTAPRSAIADHLSAVADSLDQLGDPFALTVQQAAAAVRRSAITSDAAKVTITVDGVAIPMQAVVIEQVLMPNEGSICRPTCGSPTALYTIRTLLAWDGDAMRRFVSVDVESLGADSGSLSSHGIYAERAASGRVSKAYWGISTTASTRTSTGPACGPREGPAENGLQSCALAGFQFAFAWDGRAYDPKDGASPFHDLESGAPHRVSMEKSVLIGYAIVQKVPATGIGLRAPDATR